MTPQNHHLLKSFEEYHSWIKSVVTSLSAFLGVVFVFGGNLENRIDSSVVIGCLLVCIVLSIAIGLYILSRMPEFLLSLMQLFHSDCEDKKMDYRQRLNKIKILLEVLIKIWTGFLLLTSGILILVIIKLFF